MRIPFSWTWNSESFSAISSRESVGNFGRLQRSKWAFQGQYPIVKKRMWAVQPLVETSDNSVHKACNGHSSACLSNTGKHLQSQLLGPCIPVWPSLVPLYLRDGIRSASTSKYSKTMNAVILDILRETGAGAHRFNCLLHRWGNCGSKCAVIILTWIGTALLSTVSPNLIIKPNSCAPIVAQVLASLLILGVTDSHFLNPLQTIELYHIKYKDHSRMTRCQLNDKMSYWEMFLRDAECGDGGPNSGVHPDLDDCRSRKG